MKVVCAVYTLPFHRWVLGDTVAALRALGVTVFEVTHEPKHAHDWAQSNTVLLDGLRAMRPDALLMADYPYGPFREAAGGCPVFATRHSLAARGNTYERHEQIHANYIATWSPGDRVLLEERGIGQRWWLDTGCPWAGPLLTAGPLAGPGLRAKPVIAWCPTWNDWSPDIAAELATIEGAQIVYRPHYATAWRHPEALERAHLLGFTVDDPLTHPANLLLQADILVGDVSGIVLLALAVPGARLPIVQVDPVDATGPQIERWGPEWVHRNRIGPVVIPAHVPASIRAMLTTSPKWDPWLESRNKTRKALFGADPLPGGFTPAQRLAREIECRVG